MQMGPIPPADWHGEAIVRDLITQDLFLGLFMGAFAYFQRRNVGGICLVVAGVRIVQAISKQTVRWTETSDEMRHGRLAMVALALLWIIMGIILIFI